MFLQLGGLLRYVCAVVGLGAVLGVGGYVLAGLGPVVELLRVGGVLVVLGLDGVGRAGGVLVGVVCGCALGGVLVPVLDLLVFAGGAMALVVLTVVWLVAEMGRLFLGVVLLGGVGRLLAGGVCGGVWLGLGRVRLVALGFGGFGAWGVAVVLGCSRVLVYLIVRVVCVALCLLCWVAALRLCNVLFLAFVRSLLAVGRGARRQFCRVCLVACWVRECCVFVIGATGVPTGWGGRTLVALFSARLALVGGLCLVGGSGGGRRPFVGILLCSLARVSGFLWGVLPFELVFLSAERVLLRGALWFSLALRVVRWVPFMVRVSRWAVSCCLRDLVLWPSRFRRPVGSVSGGGCSRVLVAAPLASASPVLVFSGASHVLSMSSLCLLCSVVAISSVRFLLVRSARAFVGRSVLSTLWPCAGGRWVGSACGSTGVRSRRRGVWRAWRSAARRVGALSRLSAWSGGWGPRWPSAKFFLRLRLALSTVRRVLSRFSGALRSLGLGLACRLLFMRSRLRFSSFAGRGSVVWVALGGWASWWLDVGLLLFGVA
nr:hypothetical protein [Aureimonas jatrophae]